MSGIFTPHELKTIEVDVEKNIFKINGEPFGENCTGFAIYCKGHKEFEIRVEVDAKVTYAKYGKDLKLKREVKYQSNNPLFSQKATDY